MADEGLTPELVLEAYSAGIFPMSESRDDPGVFWVDPKRRGLLPLDGFRISRSLARRIRSKVYTATFDLAFGQVLEGCADRPETWINTAIRKIYLSLHAAGHAHSVEVWQTGELVGGVYGVALGGAFFGESMFSRKNDASKVALAYLVDRLRQSGFVLFDTQFLTPHLATLGGIEISREDYRRRLSAALEVDADFPMQSSAPPAQDVLQRMTQTS